MTTDYSKLDTAALVAAADALMADVKVGEWRLLENSSIVSSYGEYVVHVNRYGVLRIDDADAAFIADAPALVRALVTRLREAANAAPLVAKFKVGDQVREVGTVRHGYIRSADYAPRRGQWLYLVAWTNSDNLPLISEIFGEDELERVENG